VCERQSLPRKRARQKHVKFEEKIEHISNIVIDQRAIPFLGAGVSVTAKYDSDIKENIHITEYMRGMVCRYIVGDSKANEFVPQSLLDEVQKVVKYEYHNKDDGKDDNKDSALIGLAEACEMALSLKANDSPGGIKKLVENVLRIPEFVHLLPTRAHRYIAFIAREGLIDEIFTTNYDCCMERAYRQSFPEEPKDAVNQIHDGRTYRQQVGRRPSFRWINKDYPRLTVYKLNGCAEAIKNGADSSTILLTERQLQNWRERQWAQDVFRDRLRSHSLIFSGFGSPEPQIRHTVIQILEEMSAGDFSDQDGEEVRAPYVVCYDPQNEPTFYQWQIVNAFCQSDGNITNRSPEDLLVTSPNGEKLSADQFWEMIYRRVTLHLLKKLLALRSEVADRIQILLCENGRILEEILLKLEKCMEESNDARYGDDDILQWLELYETTKLSRWLYLMESLGASLEQKGIYMAIWDHRILVGDLLLVWAAFIREEGKTRSSEKNIFVEEPTIGLRISLNEEGLTLYLTGTNRCKDHPISPDEGSSAQKAALLILGPKRPGVKHALVRPYRKRNDENGVQEDLILVRLYLSEVFRSSEQPPQSLKELGEFLRRVALTPTVFFRKEQPSLLSRLEQVSYPGGTE